MPNAPKIFVGNKIDLREEAQITQKDPRNAHISKETGKKIVEEEMGCKYVECSALTQAGLREVF